MKNIRFITYLLAIIFSIFTFPAVSSADNRSDITGEVSYGSLESLSGEVSAAAEDASGVTAEKPAEMQNYILMQLSNSNAVHNGEGIKLTNGYGKPVSPYYHNSLSMVPLRVISETFDYTVTWDARSQAASVTGKDINAVFTVGDSDAYINELEIGLDAPVSINNDTVYVPAKSLCKALGCYIHYYDKSVGEYLLITDSPVTSGDLSGEENVNYGSLSTGSDLLSYKELGNTYLGPSLSMYDSNTLFLRCGCTHSVSNGAESLISVTGTGEAAPIAAADGSVFVPLEYCAQAFGAQIKTSTSGDISVTYNGVTTLFPFENGYLIQNNEIITDSNYSTREFDGAVYTTAQAAADALNVNCDILNSGIIVLSAYDYNDYDNLAVYAELQAAKLLLAPVIKGYIALTFDDGPSGNLTTRLLDGLSERSVHATFFLCEYKIAQYTGLMSRYISEGHEVGNHGASHSYLTHLSDTQIDTEIDTTNAAILQYTGVAPQLFRPPGGLYNEHVLSALDDRSMSCIMWTVDPKDWQDRDSALVIERILSAVTDGSIVLLHDSYGTSIDAGLEIIDTLQAEGYKFVTVSDLAFVKGYDLQPGQIYNDFF